MPVQKKIREAGITSEERWQAYEESLNRQRQAAYDVSIQAIRNRLERERLESYDLFHDPIYEEE